MRYTGGGSAPEMRAAAHAQPTGKVARGARSGGDTMHEEVGGHTDATGGETHWLSKPELRAWLAFWGATHLVGGVIERDLQNRRGLSHGDYQILAMLSGAPDCRLRMSALAEVVFVSRSRLTYQVTQLERARLLRRENFPNDKRGLVAVLTEEGMETLRETAPGHVAIIRKAFFDVLTPEQVVTLGDAFTAIMDGLPDDDQHRTFADLWAMMG